MITGELISMMGGLGLDCEAAILWNFLGPNEYAAVLKRLNS